MATERETLQIAIETKGGEAAEAELTRIDKMVEGLSDESAIITLSIEAARVESELMDIRTQIAQLGEQAPIELKVDAAQAEAELNAVQAKLKSTLDAAPAEVKLNVTQAVGGLDRISQSANSSRSALANMIGNATQDLGALGGIAGSAGVAIGQMGEYMADAKLSGEGLGQVISNFAKAAGPIAAISVALGVATKLWADYQAQQKLVAENTAEAAEAMSEQLGLLEQIQGQFEDPAAADFFEQIASSVGKTTENIAESLGAFNRLRLANDSFNASLGEMMVALGSGDKAREQFFKGFLEGFDELDATSRGVIAQAIRIKGSYQDILTEIRLIGDEGTFEWARQNQQVITDLETIDSLIKGIDIGEQTQRILNDLAATTDGFDALMAATDRLRAEGIVDPTPIQLAQVALEELQRIQREHAKETVAEKHRLDDLAQAYLDSVGYVKNHAEAVGEDADAQREAAEAAHRLTEELRKQAEELRQRGVALGEASASLAEMEGAFDTMAQREGALERVFALGNAPLDAQADLRDITIAIDELSETAADLDLSKGIKFGDISLDPLLDAFDQLRPQIQQQIANAFEGGGPEAARTVAQGFVDNIFTELGGKVSKEDIARALGMEGGIDAFINVIVEQSAIDKAKRQLEVLTGLPGADPVYTAAIALALDAGTITGEQASALVLDAIGQVIPLPTGVEPPSAASVAAAKAALFGEDWPIPLVYQAPQTSIEEVIGIPDAVRLPTTFEPMSDAAAAMYEVAANNEPIPFGTAFTAPEQSIEEIIGTPPAIQVPYELTPGPVSIEEAIGIPPAVQVPTSADVTGATSDIAGFAGGPHPKATVAVEADSAGADAEIDGVASQGRTARIAVETSGVGAASSAIANAARNRTATITVNYVVGAVPRIDGAR